MHSQNWTTLPAGLPVPTDDGAAAHLTGTKLPSIALAATTGGAVDLSAQRGRTVVFAYPRTGRPGEARSRPIGTRFPAPADALRTPAVSVTCTPNSRL